jgi:hypothetical protein
VWLLIVCLAWARQSADKRPVVYAFGAILIYTTVWWIYSFPRQYGYAVFKMSTWLQFLLVIGYGFGLYWTWLAAVRVRGRWCRAASLLASGCLAFIVVGGNIAVSVQYGLQGLGTDPERGYIVNNFEMSGNYDYLELESAIGRIVQPGETVALALSDSIQNYWVSYYLRKFRISILSHYLMPGDDENLPDVVTRRVLDYYGNQTVDKNDWFHGACDDYILTTTPEHLNSDIIDQPLPTPIWKNGTFQLFRAGDVPNFAFAGRGFYRIETLLRPRTYWWPTKWRWTSEGGEIYVLHREQEATPYSLSFLALTGYGIPSANRLLEVWHNRRKIDEISVNGNARVNTRPFVPTKGVNLFTIRAKEKVRALPRRLALWNRSVPTDYRGLDFGMSSVRLVPSDGAGDMASPSEVIRDRDIFSRAISFNGMEVNGWVREEATFSYIRPAMTSSVDVAIMVPGVKPLPPTCLMEFTANGTSKKVAAVRPGSLTVSLPLRSLPSPSVTEIRIKPCTSFYAEGYDHRYRPVVQSVRLDQIHFKEDKESEQSTQRDGIPQAYRGLQPTGFDTDGWFLHRASLRIPAGVKEVELEVELPGWSGQQQSNLSVSVNRKTVLRRVLRPGVERLRVPIVQSEEGASLMLEAGESFRLPKPDTRSRSLRLRAVDTIP